MIELGDRVRDRITHLDGIVIARTEWLNKCIRLTIQPQKLKDGKPHDTYTVDEQQVQLLEKGAYFDSKPAYSGGPQRDESRVLSRET